MKTLFDFSNVSVSWTKYDIVRVLDLVENREVMMSYYSGDSDGFLRPALSLVTKEEWRSSPGVLG